MSQQTVERPSDLAFGRLTGGGTAIELRKPSLDWTALQKALVFTKLVYRKPRTPAGRKPAVRRPLAERQAVRATEGACAEPGPRVYEIIDGVDERLLPWSTE